MREWDNDRDDDSDDDDNDDLAHIPHLRHILGISEHQQSSSGTLPASSPCTAKMVDLSVRLLLANILSLTSCTENLWGPFNDLAFAVCFTSLFCSWNY